MAGASCGAGSKRKTNSVPSAPSFNLELESSKKKRMAAYLMCITVSGGVPIFNRKFGDIKSVSTLKNIVTFRLIGSALIFRLHINHLTIDKHLY